MLGKEMGNVGHVISHESLARTEKRPSLGKWAFVDLLGGPMFSLRLTGMMDPRGLTKDL